MQLSRRGFMQIMASGAAALSVALKMGGEALASTIPTVSLTPLSPPTKLYYTAESVWAMAPGESVALANSLKVGDRIASLTPGGEDLIITYVHPPVNE